MKEDRMYQTQRIRDIFLQIIVFLCVLNMFTGCNQVSTVEETDYQGKSQESAIEVGQNIPKINIHLDSVTLEEINSVSKHIKYGGNKVSLIIDEQEYMYDNVQIRGRGNATWLWKKKPYQLQFADEIDLFDLGTAKRWVLLANYRDVSLLRNETAFYLATALGERCAKPGRFVELYVDDSYIGLYYLCHKVEIGASRLSLQDELGVLVEIEACYKPEEIHAYSQYSKTCLGLFDAVKNGNEYLSRVALDSFVEAFDRLEYAAMQGDWDAVKKEIDVESFVRYFLVNEFAANPDGFVTSYYMYRDGEMDVIHAGPIWDFDMAFSNLKYSGGDATSANRSWAYADPRDLLEGQEHLVTELFLYLMDIPEFRKEVESMYDVAFRDAAKNITSHLYDVAEEIFEAALKDQETWHTNSTFSCDLERLTDWIEQRQVYMDILYGSRMEIEDGVYVISLCNQSKENTMLVSNDKVTKKWFFEAQEDGSYKICSKDKSLVLSLENEDSIFEGERVVWKVDNGSNGQRWFLANDVDGKVLISKLTGLVLSFSEDMTEMKVHEYQNHHGQNIYMSD